MRRSRASALLRRPGRRPPGSRPSRPRRVGQTTCDRSRHVGKTPQANRGCPAPQCSTTSHGLHAALSLFKWLRYSKGQTCWLPSTTLPTPRGAPARPRSPRLASPGAGTVSRRSGAGGGTPAPERSRTARPRPPFTGLCRLRLSIRTGLAPWRTTLIVAQRQCEETNTARHQALAPRLPSSATSRSGPARALRPAPRPAACPIRSSTPTLAATSKPRDRCDPT